MVNGRKNIHVDDDDDDDVSNWYIPGKIIMYLSYTFKINNFCTSHLTVNHIQFKLPIDLNDV